MDKLVYYRVIPFSRGEAEKAFAGENAEEISHALLGLAYYNPDWEYVCDLCIDFLTAKNSQFHALAAICLGHLARIHKNPELRKTIPLLETFLSDPQIGGTVEDAIQDINKFTKSKKHSSKK